MLLALIRKAHEAKEKNEPTLTVWGTDTPRREFLYVDELAEACIFLMEKGYDGSLLNVGTGEDVTIKELAETVKEIVGFKGELVFDTSKPDGTPRRLLDVSKIKVKGWLSMWCLKAGIESGYMDWVAN